MRHYLAPSQLFQLLMHGQGDFQDVLISVGALEVMLLWLNVKIFYLLTSKTSSTSSPLSHFSKKIWSDFLSYSYVTFCVYFRYVQSGISRSRSNTKALSAVKFFMISRKSFNFDLILHNAYIQLHQLYVRKKKTTQQYLPLARSHTTWGVKFVALFNLVHLCLGGFCTSTRTSCQALDSPLIFWFLPQEKLQID